MTSTLYFEDASGVECNIDLLHPQDALDALPTICEVSDLLEAVNLEEHKGLLLFIMEHPGLHIAISRITAVLKHFGTAMGALIGRQALIDHLMSLLRAEGAKVATLQQETFSLRADLDSQCELATNQAARIQELERELKAKARDSTPLSDLGFLDDGFQSAQAEREAQEMAAAAAAARQEKAQLEARLRQQENIYANDTTWLTAQTQEAQRNAQEMAAAAAAARREKAAMQAHMMELADIHNNEIVFMTTQTEQLQHALQGKTAAAAVAQHERDTLETQMEDQKERFYHQMTYMTTENEEVKAAASAAEERARQLQEQLHRSEDSCVSLFADLTTEQAARTEAEHRLAECGRAARERITILATFALEQTKATQADEVERATLRSRLAALEEEQRRDSAAAEPPSDARSFDSDPTPADPAALVSHGGGGPSACAPEQESSQEPPGLLRAVITGAAIASVLPQAAIMIGTSAAQCLWKSAASALVPAS